MELQRLGGARIALAERSLRLLLHLVRHRERTVMRGELLETVWPDAVVSDASVSTAVRKVRRALGERAGDGSVIRTISGRGYRFVAPVLVAAGDHEPADVPSDSPGPLPQQLGEGLEPLVGRASQLAILESRIGQVADGRPGGGGLLIIRGDAGLGKSLLVAHALQTVRDRDVTVATVHCTAREDTPPLYPITLLLRQLGQAATPLPSSASQTRTARVESAQGQPLAPVIAPREKHSATDPSACFNVFDELAQDLRAERARGAVLLLEGSHAVHMMTRAFLDFISAQLESTGVLVLMTERPPTVPDDPLNGAERLVLGRLDEAQSRQLVRAWIGTGLGQASVEEVVKAGRGNPWLLREFCRSALDPECGDATAAVLSPTLANAIRRRVSDLTPACRRAVGAAACMGEEFGGAALAELLDTSKAALRPTLDEAMGAGLLTTMPSAASRHRFEHRVIRDVILSLCDPAERLRWHHLYTDQIGQEQRHTSSTVAAKAGSAVPVDLSSRVDLLLEGARDRAREGAEAVDLERLYKQAFELAEKIGSPELTARAALGFSGCVSLRGTAVGPWPPRRVELQLLTRAQRMQAPDNLWGVLVDGRLGATLACTNQALQAADLTDDALRRAQLIGEPRLMCESLLQHARALAGPGRSAERYATATEAVLLAERSGLVDLAGDARHQQAVSRLCGGSMTEAELLRLRETPVAGDDGAGQLRQVSWSIAVALCQANLSEAQRLIRPAHVLARRVSPVAGPHLVEAMSWELDRLLGRVKVPERVKATALRHYEVAPWMAFSWLAVLLSSERWVAARSLLAVAMRSLSTLAKNRHYLPALGVATWACDLFDLPKYARVLYEHLLPYAEENVTSGDGGVYHGPVAHYLAGMAKVFGEYGMAAAHYEEAEGHIAQLGASVQSLITRKHRAFLWLAQGRRTIALQELHLVREELGALGLRGPLRELEGSARRELGRRPRPRPTSRRQGA